MYLSRIELNSHLRATMQALQSPNILHGAAEAAFPRAEEKQRILWRVDWLNGGCYLLLLSERKPDFTHITEQFGWAGQSWETKAYTPFLEQLEAGQTWRFRLRANPVYSSPERKDSHGRGKSQPCVTVSQQEKWLRSRAERHGFALADGAFRVVHMEESRFRKTEVNPGKVYNVDLSRVTFEGLLTVANADMLRQALMNGIGKGKAYGCGLLTLAR
jgi:CRISPR system Cascade subunit CasE